MYLLKINKISFEKNGFQFEPQLIGQIIDQFPFIELKFQEHDELKFANFTRMACYTSKDESQNLIAVDPRSKFLKRLSAVTGQFLDKLNPKSLLDAPSAICVNEKSNEIFIADRRNHKILVFNSDIAFLRKFGNKSKLNDPTDMVIDAEKNQLFVANYDNETVSVWDSINDNCINEFHIESPSNIRLNEKNIFILSNSESKIPVRTNQQNLIFLLNRSLLSIDKIIKIDNWCDLRGLYLDRDTYIVTSAKETANGFRFFYLIDFNGKLIFKTNSNSVMLQDFLIVNRKNMFIIERNQNMNAKNLSRRDSKLNF